MIRLLPILLILTTTACAGVPLDPQPGRVVIAPVNDPTFNESSFTAWIWLIPPLGSTAPGTIQDVHTDGADWTGVEYHPQPMWRPDRHTLTSSGPVEYHKRTMRVRCGEVKGVRVAPWGVALLSGWPPNFNRETQAFYGQQGEIVSEQPETETTWSIEFWGIEGRLRITNETTGAYREWSTP